jgi:hypothetical protein
MLIEIKALVSGVVTWIPGFRAMRRTGGTDSARYCYSVWLRHLRLANRARAGQGVPHVVAELGPGDSIGIGLCALLSGAERYFAFDVVEYPDLRSNLAIFEELVQLFRRRESIPGADEFPGLHPEIDDLSFPRELLDDRHLEASLSAARVQHIRDSIEHVGTAGSCIVYRAPWTEDGVIEPGSIDMIYSQAVLEHVVDLAAVNRAMRRWIRPGGLMTHQIDYRCHGKAGKWNGHWGYSDMAWKIVVGRRPYLLNRAAHSVQMRHLQSAGFSILRETRVRDETGITRGKLAREFRSLSDDDLTTCGAFVVCAPGATPGQ